MLFLTRRKSLTACVFPADGKQEAVAQPFHQSEIFRFNYLQTCKNADYSANLLLPAILLPLELLQPVGRTWRRMAAFETLSRIG